MPLSAASTASYSFCSPYCCTKASFIASAPPRSLQYNSFGPHGKGKGGEVALPSLEVLREGDPMSARVAEQIALGVSTRGYERSLEPIDETIETRGTSKSNAGRARPT
jgi:hypothetical protein